MEPTIQELAFRCDTAIRVSPGVVFPSLNCLSRPQYNTLQARIMLDSLITEKIIVDCRCGSEVRAVLVWLSDGWITANLLPLVNARGRSSYMIATPPMRVRTGSLCGVSVLSLRPRPQPTVQDQVIDCSAYLGRSENEWERLAPGSGQRLLMTK